MTPDFLAGLLVGSFAIYACWLLSLRLAEPADTEDWLASMERYGPGLLPPGAYAACGSCGQAVINSAAGWKQHQEFCPAIQHPDAIGDALVLLDKAFSDDAE